MIKIFQSRVNGELFLAYEVFRYENLHSDLEWSSVKAIKLAPIGILIEYKNGYVGIFKSFEALTRQADLIGEL